MRKTLQKLSVALLPVLAFQGFAHAGELGASGAGLIAELRETKGIERVGDFDLKVFEDQLKDLKWKTFSSKDPRPSFAEGRRSAYFRSDLNTVFVATDVPASAAEAVTTLELHEALGALKYNDRNYSMSSALNLLNKIKKSDDRQALAKDLGKTVFSKTDMLSSGSGTSVGGGGDLIALFVKSRVLSEFMKNRRDLSWDFLRLYPEIGFEPNYKRSQQFVALRYQARPANPESFGMEPLPGVRRDSKRGTQELISVYVPALKWQKSAAERKAIIKKISGYLADLFPITNRETLDAVNGLGCFRGETFRFPKARSVQTQMILQSRAALLTGCDPSFVISSLRIPSFDVAPTSKEIKTSLQTKLKCVLKARGAVLTDFEVSPAVGQASRAMTSSGSAPGARGIEASMLTAIVDTNARGEVSALKMINQDFATGRKKEMSGVIKPGQKTQLKGRGLWGHPLLLTCGGV
jgi:hypothetical protein